MPVNDDMPVVSVGVWHRAQPTRWNRLAPFRADWAVTPGGSAGVGGAARRMKMSKFTRSEVVPSVGLESSKPLNTHPGTALLSLGKVSLVTPDSTLYASPAKIFSDL